MRWRHFSQRLMNCNRQNNRALLSRSSDMEVPSCLLMFTTSLWEPWAWGIEVWSLCGVVLPWVAYWNVSQLKTRTCKYPVECNLIMEIGPGAGSVLSHVDLFPLPSLISHRLYFKCSGHLCLSASLVLSFVVQKFKETAISTLKNSYNQFRSIICLSST